MANFGLIRKLVYVHIMFLLGVAGSCRSSCLTSSVVSVSPTAVTVLPYAEMHVAGWIHQEVPHAKRQLPIATSIVINTDNLDSSRPVTTALADHPTSGIVRPEEDASSKIQAIFFGVAGTCIGVASLAVALLTLRATSKQRQPDPETPPPREEDCSDPSGMELTQHPSSTVSEQTLEPNTAQPAENEQHERQTTPTTPVH